VRVDESLVEGRRRAFAAARAAAAQLHDEMSEADIAAGPCFVLIARGGLLLYPALVDRFPAAQYLVVGARRTADGVELDEHAADFTELDAGPIIVADAVTATGSTITEVAARIRRSRESVELSVLALTCTTEAEARLLQDGIPVVAVARDWLIDGVPSLDLGGLDAGDTFSGRFPEMAPGGSPFVDLVQRSAVDAWRRQAIHDAVIESDAWKINAGTVLDVGCGDGVLTRRLHGHIKASRILGYDTDSMSVSLAMRASDPPVLSFTTDWNDEVIASAPYDVVNVCMVLSAVADIAPLLGRIRAVARDGGKQVWTIPHPAFTYNEQINQARLAIEEGADDVSMEAVGDGYLRRHSYMKRRSGIGFVHFHRPISWYLDVLDDAGFMLQRFREPNPSPAAPRASRFLPRVCIMETATHRTHQDDGTAASVFSCRR